MQTIILFSLLALAVAAWAGASKRFIQERQTSGVWYNPPHGDRNMQTLCIALRSNCQVHQTVVYKTTALRIGLGHGYTTVRLTTAEVVQQPHVCPIHNFTVYFILLQSPFSYNLGKGDCRSIKYT